MSAWIDIVRGGDNFQTPALQEFHQPYKTFDEQLHKHIQVLMLVCGRNCGVGRANRQIRSCRFGNTVLLDCHLHHHGDWYPSIKAGRCAPNLSQHIIKGSQNVSPMELAHQFYARALSPISEAIVFMQNEYWDIPTIVT
ncbi:hypothetical protein VFPPC_17622 [Pochonia chlamydosporia 170]|uniref:Uncharacterized protein n=1 Tax=Pochonia chlamydosporia 170 TaxID=1380566 RepID=A0A219ARH3_METCM|nr:hypothetical protein VFPPC_17622 [Pochonia chlamydosporia 170]OWT43202.1 hypothetical protein VFPPC_17622 [Pochonia chlamydosporia 170]